MQRSSAITASCVFGVLLALPVCAQTSADAPASRLRANGGSASVSSPADVTAVEVSRDTLQDASGSQADTEIEPHIAVDPNNPAIVVAVFQKGRFADGGAAAVGYATSHDGGKTWTDGDLPLLTTAAGGTFARASDPVVAFGPDGSVYAQTIAFGGSRSAISVQRSDDGGLSFGAPVLPQDDNSPDVFNDKNWITADTFPSSPHYGRLYIAWDQNNSSGAPLLLRYSDDRGETWSSVVTVSAASARTLGALPIVQPNGDLTVVYDDYSFGEKEVARTSHNGGRSFGPTVTIGDFQGGALFDVRTGGLPAATVDAVTGQLFTVWQDQRFRTDGLRDIVISSSTDGGASWSALARVNPDAPNSHLDHFTPAVAAYDGTVHVTYRARDVSAGLSPLIDLRYIVATDGFTFAGERALGDPTDLRYAAQVTTRDCINPPCYFLGDYMGLAAAEGTAHAVWCRSFQDVLSSAAQHQSTWSSTIADTCGNGVRELSEACDGADDAACPGACRSDCTCPCTNEVTDPHASVTLRTRKEAGKLSAKLTIPLAAYGGEVVAVRLDDVDSTPIASRNVQTLPPKGRLGKQWQYKVRGTGLQQVTLKDLSPRKPGMFQIVVKASKWFTAASANHDAASTQLTITLGSQCFTHAATKKTD